MQYKFKKSIVVALGGSIICPKEIDVLFLRRFKKLIEKFIKKGHRFVLVIGGGRLSRQYQEAAGRIVNLTNKDKDWVGICVTRLNAYLVRTILQKWAGPEIIDSYNKIKPLKKPIAIASGWRPGWSTDYISVAIADALGIDEVIIAGKPAFVYDKNPDDHRDAKEFKRINWLEYRKLIPAKWAPGLHSPVDPVAAKLAQRKNIKAIIIDGRNLKNFENLLNSKNFQGTIIE